MTFDLACGVLRAIRSNDVMRYGDDLLVSVGEHEQNRVARIVSVTSVVESPQNSDILCGYEHKMRATGAFMILRYPTRTISWQTISFTIRIWSATLAHRFIWRRGRQGRSMSEATEKHTVSRLVISGARARGRHAYGDKRRPGCAYLWWTIGAHVRCSPKYWTMGAIDSQDAR